jgi:hypothetical protein
VSEKAPDPVENVSSVATVLPVAVSVALEAEPVSVGVFSTAPPASLTPAFGEANTSEVLALVTPAKFIAGPALLLSVSVTTPPVSVPACVSDDASVNENAPDPVENVSSVATVFPVAVSVALAADPVSVGVFRTAPFASLTPALGEANTSEVLALVTPVKVIAGPALLLSVSVTTPPVNVPACVSDDASVNENAPEPVENVSSVATVFPVAVSVALAADPVSVGVFNTAPPASLTPALGDANTSEVLALVTPVKFIAGPALLLSVSVTTPPVNVPVCVNDDASVNENAPDPVENVSSVATVFPVAVSVALAAEPVSVGVFSTAPPASLTPAFGEANTSEVLALVTPVKFIAGPALLESVSVTTPPVNVPACVNDDASVNENAPDPVENVSSVATVFPVAVSVALEDEPVSVGEL